MPDKQEKDQSTRTGAMRRVEMEPSLDREAPEPDMPPPPQHDSSTGSMPIVRMEVEDETPDEADADSPGGN